MERRLQLMGRDGDMSIMVVASFAVRLNDNDYYLVNDSIIRKELIGHDEPERIKLYTENNEVFGVFQRVLNTDNVVSVACWEKI